MSSLRLTSGGMCAPLQRIPNKGGPVVRRTLSLVCVLSAAGAPCRLVGQTVVDKSERVAASFEAIEAGKAKPQSMDRLRPGLERARDDIKGYLDSHPDDVRALIVYARLGRALGEGTVNVMPVVTRIASGTETTEDTADPGAVYEAALAHAIQLQPSSAAAYYWRGRLYAVPHPTARDKTFAMSFDTTRAIADIQRAAALDSLNADYKEALGIFEFRFHSLRGAADAFRGLSDHDYPDARFVRHELQVPIPPDAVYAPQDAYFMFEMFEDKEQPYFLYRLVAYRSSMTFDSLVGFYRAQWPGFSLYSVRRDSTHDFGVQLLTLAEGRLIPADDSAWLQKDARTGTVNGLSFNIRCDHTEKPSCRIMILDEERL